MTRIIRLVSSFGMDYFEVAKDINIEIIGVITPKEKYEFRYGEGCSKK